MTAAFKPMLASPADLATLRYPVLASPKLDGVRAIVKDGVVLSRSLKPIPNKHVQSLFSKCSHLDGELIVGSVCKRWEKFENFLLDMGLRPQGMTIDRVNNDSDYKPSNCCWATRKEQNNKRRQCRYITYKNKTRTIAQWCEELSLNYARTYNRLVVQLLSPAEAFAPAKRKTV